MTRPPILTLFLILAVLTAPAAGAGTITERREGPDLIKRLDGEDCGTSLERRDGEDYLHLRDTCGLALADKIAALARLAGAFEAGRDFPAGVSSLGIGRLVRWPELARELALAAYRSPDWDAAAGRPRGAAAGDSRALHAFFVAQALDMSLLDPLLVAFAAEAVTLETLSVEKVLVGRPDQTPFNTWLRNQGVPAEAKLPFDAIVWLVLKAATRE